MKQTAWTILFFIGLGSVFAFTNGSGVTAGLQASISSNTRVSPFKYLHNQYVVSQQNSGSSAPRESTQQQKKAFRQFPFEKQANTSEQTPPRISADAALVMDFESKQMLYEQKPYTKRNIASLTKIMTGMTILDSYTYGNRVELPMTRSAFEAYGGNYIRPQETLSVEELLHALLMASSNDAAARLAEHFGGNNGAEQFVQEMNQKAEKLGLYKTQFANSHGLNAEENKQHSTAFDVMKLGKHMYTEYPTLNRILKVEETTLTTQEGREIPVKNINELLGKLNTESGKTGYTEEAGETFFTVAEVEGRTVGFVVLGSSIGSRFEDTRTLIEWTRSTYTKRSTL
ncbi:MAG: hypothetical protein BRC23_00245 [Parcubacteria group bacterium SW_4_49_11]|nr:MAG: hypothetical protein BRC23_00245 [Parcubacteria group bacterium SW_4_49_11]